MVWNPLSPHLQWLLVFAATHCILPDSTTGRPPHLSPRHRKLNPAPWSFHCPHYNTADWSRDSVNVLEQSAIHGTVLASQCDLPCARSLSKLVRNKALTGSVSHKYLSLAKTGSGDAIQHRSMLRVALASVSLHVMSWRERNKRCSKNWIRPLCCRGLYHISCCKRLRSSSRTPACSHDTDFGELARQRRGSGRNTRNLARTDTGQHLYIEMLEARRLHGNSTASRCRIRFKKVDRGVQTDMMIELSGRPTAQRDLRERLSELRSPTTR